VFCQRVRSLRQSTALSSIATTDRRLLVGGMREDAKVRE